MNKIARSWLITIHWWISVSFSGSLDSITPRGPLSADLHQRDLSIRGRSQHPSFDPIILSNSNPESAPRISPRRRPLQRFHSTRMGNPNERTRGNWKVVFDRLIEESSIDGLLLHPCLNSFLLTPIIGRPVSASVFLL